MLREGGTQGVCPGQAIGQVEGQGTVRVVSTNPTAKSAPALAKERTLAVRFPAQAAEWHATRNGELTPSSVSWGSRRKVWWRCAVCANEWLAYVVHRTSHGTGCPRCAPCSRSQVEIAVACELTKFIKFDPEDRYVVTEGRSRPWEVDICLRKNMIAIEYDGKWWHDGAQRLAGDRAKTKDLTRNGWTVIRVRVGLRKISALDVRIESDDAFAATVGVLERLCRLGEAGRIAPLVNRVELVRYQRGGVRVGRAEAERVVSQARELVAARG